KQPWDKDANAFGGNDVNVQVDDLEKFYDEKPMEEAADLGKIEENEKVLGTEMSSIKDDQVNAERKGDTDHDDGTSSSKGKEFGFALQHLPLSPAIFSRLPGRHVAGDTHPG
ncbi:hypothetical protein Tco_0376884, partial [Tanacetum coccineum]